MPSKRVDLKAILHNPVYRRELMVGTIVATQAREGITTTQEQAESAYDKVLMTLANKNCSCDGRTDPRCESCVAGKELRRVGYVRDLKAENWWRKR